MSKIAELASNDTTARGREALKHYGIPGMKWGRRSSSPATVTTQTVVNNGLRGKTKVKAAGGTAHPAAADAVKAAAQKQKLKKSGPAALSNKELQELSTRLNLERQVSELAAPAGRKFVTKTLKTEGQNQIRREINEGVTNQVKKAKS